MDQVTLQIEDLYPNVFFYTNVEKIKQNWPHQLCKKLVKETIFNIWRNEKYFSVLLIYQLFGYNFGKIQYKNLVYNDFNWILPK